METGWGKVGSISAFCFLLSALALAGCASPHRAAVTTHEIYRYQGRCDGLIAYEAWKDSERGGGWFLFTDPDVQSINAIHTNQTALGGGSVLNSGGMKLTLDPQTGAVIGATGTAVGNIVGAAIKTAIKP